MEMIITYAKEIMQRYSMDFGKMNIPETCGKVFISTLFIMLLMIPSVANSQGFSSKIAADAAVGYVFPTHKFLRGHNETGSAINTTVATHLKYAFQFNPNTRLGREYPYTYQGIGFSYNTFFNDKEIGSPIGIYLFQHSRILSIGRKLSLDYEWNFGVSWNWKCYNEKYNVYNEVVGSRINAYINLGLMFNWNFAPYWNLMMGGEVTHFSNGNTSFPNYGVNTLGFRAGVVREFGNNSDVPKASAYKDKEGFNRHFTYDVVFYGAIHKIGITAYEKKFVVPNSFTVAGINVNPMYNFNRYLRAGISLDAQYDEAANLDITVDEEINRSGSSSAPMMKYTINVSKPPLKEQFSMGVSLRGEVVMPIFAINFGVGSYFISRGDQTYSFYQILALKTSITKHLFLHTGCQFYDFEKPCNLMLGLGIRFNAGKR